MKKWTRREIKQLLDEIVEGVSREEIAARHGRPRYQIDARIEIEGNLCAARGYRERVRRNQLSRMEPQECLSPHTITVRPTTKPAP
jgi:hypothetical protein